MKRHLLMALSAICLLSTSCGTLPAVEESTGFTAADIARKVRCELRDAFEDKAAAWLAEEFSDDPYVRQEVPLLQTDVHSFRSVEMSRLPPVARIYIEHFMKAAVAYDFTLGITEVNDAGAEVNLAGILSGNPIKLGMAAGIDRSRNHEQTFYLVETFGHLTKEVEDGYCDAKRMPGFFSDSVNIVYPMAGRINIKKPLDEFVDLSLFANLSRKDKGAPTLTSSLTFKTKIYGNATPEISSSPALTKASLGIKNSREDVHKVVVAFSIPDPPPLLPESRRDTFVSSAGTQAEKAAAEAVNNFIVRREVGRF